MKYEELKFFPDGTAVDKFFFNIKTPEQLLDGKKRFDVTDYGVIADRPDILQTEKIQKIIDLASEQGGGVIVFPAGYYLSGALFFKKNTALHVEKGAVIYGSKEICDFAILDSRMEGENVKYFAALINADNVDNFSISGGGTLDGQGLFYWKHFWLRRKFNPDCTNMDEMRPRLLFISNSKNVTITEIHLRNSPFWTGHFYKCDFLQIINIDIFAPAKPVPSPSTDGIDLDVCNNVLIKNCYIEVNDDSVALKGGKGPLADKLPENGSNTNIIITDCVFGYSHSALTCGSETVHNNNIIMTDCEIRGVERMFYLKMRPDTKQMSENILINNIHGECGLMLLADSWTQFRRCPELLPSHGSNITFSNLSVKCNKICAIGHTEEYTLENFIFRKSHFTAKEALNIPDDVKNAFSLEDCIIDL